MKTLIKTIFIIIVSCSPLKKSAQTVDVILGLTATYGLAIYQSSRLFFTQFASQQSEIGAL